jgi:hypothetical protein
MTPEIQNAIDALKLSLEATFVPFSQSRSKDSEYHNLNWVVTIKRDGKDVLTTDYSAGMGHCPSYNAKTVPTRFHTTRYRSRATTPSGWTYRNATTNEGLNQYRIAIATAECESGMQMELDRFGDNAFKVKRVRATDPDTRRSVQKAVPIMPDPADVLYSLVMDSAVLDSGGFEDWAADYGYGTDSRQAETVYKECLEIALKMRVAIGESGLGMLQDVFEDY